MRKASISSLPSRQQADWLTLDNGLVVVVQREPAFRRAVVCLTYHIGSRDEPKSKNGLAHVFEHLMFAGTSVFPGNAFVHLEDMGASSINAISREDYTSYFELVPPASLNQVLAFESERARYLPSAFDSAELERTRQIVRNELLERASQPYGIVDKFLAVDGHPPGHQYSTPSNGTLEDLDNIGLRDTADWFQRHSSRAYASIVIVGPVEEQDIFAQAQRYFGNLFAEATRITKLPPVSPGIRAAQKRRRVAHHHNESRIYLAWNLPGFDQIDRATVRLLLELLILDSVGRTNPLEPNKQPTLASGGELRIREYASQLILWHQATAHFCFETAENIIRDRLHSIIQRGVSEGSIAAARLRAAAKLDYSYNAEKQAQLLATGWQFVKNPNFYTEDLAHLASTTLDRLQELAAALGEPSLVLEIEGHNIRPLRRLSISQQPKPSWGLPAPSLRMKKPGVCNQLSSVVVASCPRAKLFDVRLIIEGGFAQEQARFQGLTAISAFVLVERLKCYVSRFEQHERPIVVESEAFPDAVVFRLRTKCELKGLKLLHHMLTATPVDETLVSQAQQAQTAVLVSERAQPFKLALRVLPALLCASSTGYGASWTGTGTDRGIKAVTANEVSELLHLWRTERYVKIAAAGPKSRQALLASSASVFAGFPTQRHLDPPVNSATILLSTRSQIALSSVLGDKTQVALFASLAVRHPTPQQLDALMLTNAVLGGPSSSRLNLRLREARQFTYGARTQLLMSNQICLWLAVAKIRPDAVIPAMREIEEITTGLADEHLPSEAELSRARAFVLSSLLAHEPHDVVSAAAKIESSLIYGVPARDCDTARRISHVSVRDISDACRMMLAQSRMQWLLLGETDALSRALYREGYTDLYIL